MLYFINYYRFEIIFILVQHGCFLKMTFFENKDHKYVPSFHSEFDFKYEFRKGQELSLTIRANNPNSEVTDCKGKNKKNTPDNH